MKYDEKQEIKDWKQYPLERKRVMDSIADTIFDISETIGHKEACRIVLQEASKWFDNSNDES